MFPRTLANPPPPPPTSDNISFLPYRPPSPHSPQKGRHMFITAYWVLFVQAMSDSMPPDAFERIPRNLHLCDNENLHKQDNF